MGTLMAASFAGTLVCFQPLFFARAFKRFINYDPSRDSVESLMG